MSDGHDHDDHGAADAHQDHGFDGEPAKELGPDEPLTPAWVPALGGVLFVGLAIFALVQTNDGPGSGAAPGAAATNSAAAAQGAPAMRPVTSQMVAQPLPSMQRPTTALPPGQNPGGAGQPTLNKLSPEQMKELEKRIREAQQKVDGAKPQ